MGRAFSNIDIIGNELIKLYYYKLNKYKVVNDS